MPPPPRLHKLRCPWVSTVPWISLPRHTPVSHNARLHPPMKPRPYKTSWCAYQSPASPGIDGPSTPAGQASGVHLSVTSASTTPSRPAPSPALPGRVTAQSRGPTLLGATDRVMPKACPHQVKPCGRSRSCEPGRLSAGGPRRAVPVGSRQAGRRHFQSRQSCSAARSLSAMRSSKVARASLRSAGGPASSRDLGGGRTRRRSSMRVALESIT